MEWVQSTFCGFFFFTKFISILTLLYGFGLEKSKIIEIKCEFLCTKYGSIDVYSLTATRPRVTTFVNPLNQFNKKAYSVTDRLAFDEILDEFG